ncbi:MAG: hypothetical protein SFV23_22990 [Planctomycetaceae bacterium]|nr:hypothetical protein [Planctomycetaceae bacterium]
MGELWQLTRLSLVNDSRRAGLHAVRFGLVLVLYLAIVVTHLLSTTTAAGLPLFRAQLLITAFYLSVNAIFGFSQSIAEEREDESLGLMRLAGVSALAILFGKTLSRLIDAGLLIAIQLPFTIVAVTLGGVSIPQVSAAYGALFAYLWLLATIGIAASVRAPSGGAAARWTGIFLAIYVLPPFLSMLTTRMPSPLLRQFYDLFSLPLRFMTVTESAFNDPVWCWPILFALAFGMGCLIDAWRMFDRVAVGREVIGKVSLLPPLRKHAPRRAWDLPILGRVFQFETGGKRWVYFRAGAQLAILAAMFLVQETPGRCFVWALLWGGLLCLFDATWSASGLFRNEIREQTWSTLVQTPRGLVNIVTEKWIGWALGLAPSIVLPYAWCAAANLTADWVPFEAKVELTIGSLTFGVGILAYLQLLVLLTLYFGWQATPLTLTICFAAGWVYVIAVHATRWSTSTRCVFFVATWLVLAGVIVFLWRLSLARLRELAATG